jgi:hypothetical protein
MLGKLVAYYAILLLIIGLLETTSHFSCYSLDLEENKGDKCTALARPRDDAVQTRKISNRITVRKPQVRVSNPALFLFLKLRAYKIAIA